MVIWQGLQPWSATYPKRNGLDVPSPRRNVILLLLPVPQRPNELAPASWNPTPCLIFPHCLPSAQHPRSLLIPPMPRSLLTFLSAPASFCSLALSTSQISMSQCQRLNVSTSLGLSAFWQWLFDPNQTLWRFFSESTGHPASDVQIRTVAESAVAEISNSPGPWVITQTHEYNAHRIL